MDKMQIHTLKNSIEKLTDMDGYKPLKFREFAYVLDVHSKGEKSMLSQALNLMISEEKLVYAGGRYHRPDENIFECTYQMAGPRFGFALTDRDGDDIFIAAENSANAFEGDRILVRIIKDPAGGRKAEGRVIKITQKAKREVVGDFYRRGRNGFVECPGKLSGPVMIDYKDFGGARNGDKVLTRIHHYRSSGYLRGSVVRVMGKSGNVDTELNVLISSSGLERKFSGQVMNCAEKIEYDAPEPFRCARRNLEDHVIFTIDGTDARDMDDAVEIEKDADGWLLSVHIADVSNYVTEGSAVDTEAYERGVSTYLPPFVIPMLPERLSNDLCSLNPNEKKKTLSVTMRIDDSGNIIDYEFYKAEIISKARLDYDSVNALFEGRKTSGGAESVSEELLMMRELYRILKARRMKGGMIDFDTEESTASVKDGKVTISVRERGEAEELIEHFMLSANECAASFISDMGIDGMYRVHENPKKEDAMSFSKISARLGKPINARDFSHSGKVMKYLESIKETEGEEILKTMLLRCMARARYCEENLGHYALGFRNYTHFTSPIRRYPDLIVHRIISSVLSGELEGLYGNSEKIRKQAIHLSGCERRSQELEREAFKLYACEYLEHVKKKKMYATVSGFSGRGMFVRLKNGIEGLCPFAFMADYYVIDPDGFSMVGEYWNEVFTISHRVEVELMSVSKQQRQIDFLLKEME